MKRWRTGLAVATVALGMLTAGCSSGAGVALKANGTAVSDAQVAQAGAELAAVLDQVPGQDTGKTNAEQRAQINQKTKQLLEDRVQALGQSDQATVDQIDAELAGLPGSLAQVSGTTSLVGNVVTLLALGAVAEDLIAQDPKLVDNALEAATGVPAGQIPADAREELVGALENHTTMDRAQALEALLGGTGDQLPAAVTDKPLGEVALRAITYQASIQMIQSLYQAAGLDAVAEAQERLDLSPRFAAFAPTRLMNAESDPIYPWAVAPPTPQVDQ